MICKTADVTVKNKNSELHYNSIVRVFKNIVLILWTDS